MSTNDLRYARRVTLRVKRGQIGEFLRTMRDGIFPRLKEQAGIRRMYLLSSTGGNEFLSVTLWNNKSSADAYGESVAFQRNTKLVRDLLESDPVVSEFDVEFHDVNAKDLPPPKSTSTPEKSVPEKEVPQKSAPAPKKSAKSKRSR